MILSALLLFGLDLAPLFDAMADVESDHGATSANVYQIREAYVADLNRIYGEGCAEASGRFDLRDSERMMVCYWRHYGERYRRMTGCEPTYETLARIHNGGPDGWRRSATDAYWRKVEARLGYLRTEGRRSITKGTVEEKRQ